MRVKHGSDTYPEIIIKSAGKTQVRYDIEASEFEEMDGTKRTCYDFSYVAIEGELTRAKSLMRLSRMKSETRTPKSP